MTKTAFEFDAVESVLERKAELVKTRYQISPSRE